jgi:hypothetical protein
MPSLANTLRMCHSTVRVLMNSSAAISALVRPSRASRMMCFSYGVSWLWVSTSRLRAFSPVASSSRRAFGEDLGADVREEAVGGVELMAGVGAAVLPAQPFAVEQVGVGQFGPQWCAAQPLDRPGVALLGLRAFADQRPRPRFQAFAQSEPSSAVADSRSSASLAVPEHRRGPVGQMDGESLPAGLRVLNDRRVERFRFRRPATVRREPQIAGGRLLDPGHLLTTALSATSDAAVPKSPHRGR